MLAKGVSGAGLAADCGGGAGGKNAAAMELGSDATGGTGKPPDIRCLICNRQASLCRRKYLQ
jgi:hypothetical protein